MDLFDLGGSSDISDDEAVDTMFRTESLDNLFHFFLQVGPGPSNYFIKMDDVGLEAWHDKLLEMTQGKLDISLEGEPLQTKLLPCLYSSLEYHTCVALHLWRHYSLPQSDTRHKCQKGVSCHLYHHPLPTCPSDQFLIPVIKHRCAIQYFTGQISGGLVPSLPKSLRIVHLSVGSTEQARYLLPQLNLATKKMSFLRHFHLHVARGVAADALSTLPQHPRINIELIFTYIESGDIPWVVEAAQRMEPKKKGYRRIWFQRTILDEASWVLLVRSLCDKVFAKEVRVPAFVSDRIYAKIERPVIRLHLTVLLGNYHGLEVCKVIRNDGKHDWTFPSGANPAGTVTTLNLK